MFDKEMSGGGHPWKAQIFMEGRLHPLGHYATEVEAAHAFDQAAKEHFKTGLLHLNFPPDDSKKKRKKSQYRGKSH